GKDQALEPLGKGLAEMLISDLAGATDGVKIVERARLEEVLAEQKLGRSGKVDTRTAARIGKLLGARYLVLGSYFDAMGTFRADPRLVDVETGEIVKALGATGKPDDFLALEQGLADGLRQAIAKLPAPAGAAAAAAAAHAEHHASPKPPKHLKNGT